MIGQRYNSDRPLHWLSKCCYSWGTVHCRSLFEMSRFHLLCFVASVLTGMCLVNSNTPANETDSACRGPKGEKVAIDSLRLLFKLAI